jgi:hypothetical protein
MSGIVHYLVAETAAAPLPENGALYKAGKQKVRHRASAPISW